MEKFYIESVSTLVRTISFVGMVLGNTPIKIVSAIFMIGVNVAKVCYEYHKAKIKGNNTIANHLHINA